MSKLYSSPFPAALVRVLLAVLLLALRLPAVAQAPAWQSAQAVAVAPGVPSASNSSMVSATAVDAVGNVYLAGRFTNTVVFGGTTLTSLGGNDVFVAKFNPASNLFVWAQRAGGIGNDEAYALAVNGTSVYVAGGFSSSTAGFGLATLTNAGAYDVFVAKITDSGSTGSFVWTQRAGGTSSEQATALAVSGTSVYVEGFFSSFAAGFGPTTLVTAGSGDVFVAKLTDAGPTGSFAWAQRAGGTGDDLTTALTLSGNSVYVIGYFNSPTAVFGPTTLTNGGGYDVFVAKLTDSGPTGNFVWAQRAGGTGTDVTIALAVSGSSVYVAGGFESPTADFGPVTLTNAGSRDVFVAKLTDAGPTGSFAWAQRAGGTGSEDVNALAVSGTNVYVAGDFTGLAASFGSTTLASAGSADIFVAKLTDAGTIGSFAWAQRAGGTRDDFATALALSRTSVYVAGYFNSSPVGFGAIALANSNSPASLGFLAALTDPTLTATTAAGPREPAALFPNPARHMATLRLPAGTAPAPLTLADALGRAVRCYSAPAGPEASLDLRGLPAGLYLLRGAGPAQRLAVE